MYNVYYTVYERVCFKYSHVAVGRSWLYFLIIKVVKINCTVICSDTKFYGLNIFLFIRSWAVNFLARQILSCQLPRSSDTELSASLLIRSWTGSFLAHQILNCQLSSSSDPELSASILIRSRTVSFLVHKILSCQLPSSSDSELSASLFIRSWTVCFLPHQIQNCQLPSCSYGVQVVFNVFDQKKCWKSHDTIALRYIIQRGLRPTNLVNLRKNKFANQVMSQL